MTALAPLLNISGLNARFTGKGRPVPVLEDVSLRLETGEILAIVGESGSGKSVTAQSILRLLDKDFDISADTMTFEGQPIGAMSGKALRNYRGHRAAMIFQSPRSALNPIRAVGEQIADVIVDHGAGTRRQARSMALDLLQSVGIADPQRRFSAIPSELSGGMCQRVAIAMALACRPALLIADEPTTGIDVTTQAVIMDLLVNLVREHGAALMLITHDIALAYEYCDRIVVMHAGHVVETGPAAAIVHEPLHPYTRGLIKMVPQPQTKLFELTGLVGVPPDLSGDLTTCRFYSRCPMRQPICATTALEDRTVSPAHTIRCTLA